MMARTSWWMSFAENSLRILCLDTCGTGLKQGTEGARMSMLGAAGVAGADFPTGSDSAMREGSILVEAVESSDTLMGGPDGRL